MSDIYKYKEGLVCLVPKEGRGGITSHEKTLCDCQVLEIFDELEKLKAENQRLEKLTIQLGETRCPACGEESVNLYSLELYENSQKKEITKLTRQNEIMKKALNEIASWSEGEHVGPSFDEPGSAYDARLALKECEGV